MEENSEVNINEVDCSSSESSTGMSYVAINIHDEDDVNLGKINEENMLIDYTKNHFMNKINDELYENNEPNGSAKILRYVNSLYDLQNINFSSDSPMTLSNENSDDSENDEIHNRNVFLYEKEFQNIESEPVETLDARFADSTLKYKKPTYKKLSYSEVEVMLSKYYNNENKYSSELDILVTYLKGQKTLYNYSSRITKRKLGLLTIPALLFTAALAVFAPFMENVKRGAIVISILNGLITLLISTINYLKLESSSEMYLYMANKYEKLQVMLELSSNKLAFITNEKDQNKLVLEKIKELENKLYEIKESNSILIPNELRKIFPVIYHINIFSFIKKIETSKKNLITKFKDVKNEIRYIMYKLNNLNIYENNREKNRLEYLVKIKDKIKAELQNYNNAYDSIDTLFTIETLYGEGHTSLFWYPFYKTKINENIEKNPVVNDYLQFILES